MVNKLMYAQVSAVLNKMNKEDLEKIPKGLLDTIEQSKDKEAEINLDPKIPLEDQNLSNETIAMLALLNYKYWADDNERESLKAKYEENDRIKDTQNSMDAIRKYSKSSLASVVLSITILILIILLILVHFLNKVKDNVEEITEEKDATGTNDISADEHNDDEYILVTEYEYNSKHLHESKNNKKKPHQRNKDRKK